VPEEWKDYPRPRNDYYELRHEFLTQGDILRDVPWSLLGPTINIVEPPPEGLPVPAGYLPALIYLWPHKFGIILSDTCDFRHPRAQDIPRDPGSYRSPDSVYHSGFLRVAPIFPLPEYPGLAVDEALRQRIREYDHFRRLMYLPPIKDLEGKEVMPEGLVAINQADLLSLDIVRRLDRLAQLTLVGRQQLNRKLVYADTGYQVAYDRFTPDLD